VSVAVLPRSAIEGHDANAGTFQSVDEGKHIAYLVLDVEGDVLQSAEMEEGLYPQFLNGGMLQ
jgi:hypothetical protein